MDFPQAKQQLIGWQSDQRVFTAPACRIDMLECSQ
jgi:hypothetical protein